MCLFRERTRETERTQDVGILQCSFIFMGLGQETSLNDIRLDLVSHLLLEK